MIELLSLQRILNIRQNCLFFGLYKAIPLGAVNIWSYQALDAIIWFFFEASK